MQLSLSLRQELRLTGGYSETIFPHAERMLNISEVLSALKYVACRKQMDCYCSVMDFFFCEFAGEPWIKRCKQFYDGNGKQLQEILSIDEIEQWDHLLCAALRFAMKVQDEKLRKYHWIRFCFDFRNFS